ncbi:hypothetical protein [Roseiterribacter gracilis]|uniref:DUF2147 domain-containing protein n=1 Tax=Roseiterribacter gracilis TaxID=2812848 RepID=A0A8S8XE17_9PROT|nr:hypothetical protein TMPK1_18840 [Rhodospirillales bacterium TMPK1]
MNKLVLLLLVGSLCAASAQAETRKGNIPEGVWVLNQARSHKLQPTEQVLWIIKDDGKELIWVSVETDAQKKIVVSSWSGPYDAAPIAATGTGALNQLTSRAPGIVRNYGEVPNVGSYDEDCVVMAKGKRMKCTGVFRTPQGAQNYVEDFDWTGPGPRPDPIRK